MVSNKTQQLVKEGFYFLYQHSRPYELHWKKLSSYFNRKSSESYGCCSSLWQINTKTRQSCYFSPRQFSLAVWGLLDWEPPDWKASGEAVKHGYGWLFGTTGDTETLLLFPGLPAILLRLYVGFGWVRTLAWLLDSTNGCQSVTVTLPKQGPWHSTPPPRQLVLAQGTLHNPNSFTLHGFFIVHICIFIFSYLQIFFFYS